MVSFRVSDIETATRIVEINFVTLHLLDFSRRGWDFNCSRRARFLKIEQYYPSYARELCILLCSAKNLRSSRESGYQRCISHRVTHTIHACETGRAERNSTHYFSVAIARETIYTESNSRVSNVAPIDLNFLFLLRLAAPADYLLRVYSDFVDSDKKIIQTRRNDFLRYNRVRKKKIEVVSLVLGMCSW